MKLNRIALFLLLPLLLLTACKETAKPVPEPEPDALGLRWGMSVPAVDAIYPPTEVFVNKEGVTVWERGTKQLLEREWTFYTYEEADKLLSAVALEIEVATEADREDIFGQVYGLLTQRYGSIKAGKADGGAGWETPRTVIFLMRNGDKRLKLTYLARPGYADLDKL